MSYYDTKSTIVCVSHFTFFAFLISLSSNHELRYRDYYFSENGIRFIHAILESALNEITWNIQGRQERAGKGTAECVDPRFLLETTSLTRINDLSSFPCRRNVLLQTKLRISIQDILPNTEASFFNHSYCLSQSQFIFLLI